MRADWEPPSCSLTVCLKPSILYWYEFAMRKISEISLSLSLLPEVYCSKTGYRKDNLTYLTISDHMDSKNITIAR